MTTPVPAAKKPAAVAAPSPVTDTKSPGGDAAKTVTLKKPALGTQVTASKPPAVKPKPTNDGIDIN